MNNRATFGQNSLSRLIAARALIQNAPLALTSISSSLTVAQAVVAIHDAAELVFWVLVSEQNLQAKEIDGRVKLEPTFMASARAAIDATYPDDSVKKKGVVHLVEELNRLRVGFKHHGQLPNVPTTYQLPSDVVNLLKEICEQSLNTPLSTVDTSFAVHSEQARQLFSEARQAIEEREFKRALELISKCLATAFWENNVSSSVSVGTASTEDALLLSGRGVDPAAFLTMQKIIPRCYVSSEPEWDLRGTGHEANWTFENAFFCLETAIEIVLALQATPHLPYVFDFHDIYDDVVEIKEEKPNILFARGHLSSLGFMKEEKRLKKDDRVLGVAHGKLRLSPSVNDEEDVPFEFAEYIALSNPTHPALGKRELTAIYLFGSDVLWFKKSEVELSYQSNGRKEEREAWLLEQADGG